MFGAMGPRAESGELPDVGDRSSTCWTVIEAAAAGGAPAREEFAVRYAPLVRTYLLGRWRGRAMQSDLDDAVQDVFLDCFREGGALGRVDSSRPGGFRAFLYGVVRNVARRFEERRAEARRRGGADPVVLEDVPEEGESPSEAFDRAWAMGLLREAADRHAARGRRDGEEGWRRTEILRLRFREDLPLREIARRWGMDPDRIHREYARARREFEEILLEVVGFHTAGTPGEVRREAERLLGLLA